MLPFILSIERKQHLLKRNPTMTLDEKDKELIKHLAEGKPNKEVAQLVNLSVKTVEWRLHKLRKALNCKNTIQLLLQLQKNAAI